MGTNNLKQTKMTKLKHPEKPQGGGQGKSKAKKVNRKIWYLVGGVALLIVILVIVGLCS